MITYRDICKDLLFKLDELCTEHEIKYVVDKNIMLSLYQNGDILDNEQVGVMMTLGDAERFIDIVEQMSDDKYYVEYFLNNPKAKNFSIRFGNSQTTMINLMSGRSHCKHGIFISILPINKPTPSKIQYSLRMAMVRGLNINNKSDYNKRNYLLGSILDKLIAIPGKTRTKHSIYNYMKKHVGIDSWDDIQHSELKLDNTTSIAHDTFNHISRFYLDNHGVNIMGTLDETIHNFFSNVDTAGVKAINPSNYIIDTLMPFAETLSLLENNPSFCHANDLKDKVKAYRKKQTPYIKESYKVYQHYLMAKDVYDISLDFKEIEGKLLELNLPQDAFEYYSLIEKYIETKKKWERNGLDFPENPGFEAAIRRYSQNCDMN